MTQPFLMNVTEEIVRGLVRFLLYGVEYQTFCHCEQCEMNIIAEALNNLLPQYVTSHVAREEAFKILNTPQNIEAINKEIIHAIHKVGQGLGHGE
ncbi:late competence development ComFB family protein [Metasolibacillus meyeri]|uniref:Late competence development ComFB family protein n=2 Tax=Metasolibacillus meyeri TaxID=1071052 RepID=A0AAW9NX82_9BACL|nr:late competence development ComFB family protein [Metasolibacillus meyeri]MEC1180710.1 late competence development ComFB family protein [Metasolibacillus meyeri]